MNTSFFPILQREGKKKIWTPAIPHISQEPHECDELSGVQIFLVEDTVKIQDPTIQHPTLLANLLLVHTPTCHVHDMYMYR